MGKEQLWKYRNELAFGKGNHSWEHAIGEGIRLATDYGESNKGVGRMVSDKSEVVPNDGIQSRSRSGAYFVKLSCDGAWDKNGGNSVVGAIIHDEAGSFVEGLFKAMGKVESDLATEALAIREGLEFAKQLGWRRVEVESYSKYLIQVLTNVVGIPMEIDVVITDVLHWSKNMEVRFMFTKRFNNNAAHRVAHWNYGSKKRAIWLNTPSHWLISSLVEDCNS
ncbi:hypothetical protein LIER_01195 [Lithospermum erythrorhizon]|uniref:RNase H type-1 domain-containing protein n=1 Tax=Lithospermum erythrorhizon TaxID=34254 RepID=A0AAV3NK27_LITER